MYKQQIYIAIDLETTGLDDEKHFICQFGCTVFQLGQILGTRAWDVQVPTWGIAEADPKALEVNGFTPERMAAGQPIVEVIREFERYAMSFADASVRWGAVFHNAPFDVGFLRAVKHAIPPHTMTDCLLRRVLDTVTMAWMNGAGDGDSLSLNALAIRFLNDEDFSPWNRHDAGEDSLVTAKLARTFYFMNEVNQVDE